MKKLLVITNLFPLPWQPDRATFNRQQFDRLSAVYKISFLVPVAWPNWFSNVAREGSRCFNSITHKNIRYTWYFYTPKLGRFLYGIFMFMSLVSNSIIWIYRNKPDLVIGCYAYPDGLAACLLAKLLRKNFLLKVHGSDINIQTNSVIIRMQIQYIASQATGILAVSEALKDKLVDMGVDKEKIKVIYNGVDHSIFNREYCKASSYDCTFLYIGNLKESKGIFDLLNAFDNLITEKPNATLTYVGPGNKQKVLEHLIKSRSLEGSVKVLGGVHHDQLPKVIHKSFCIVLPSYNEGVPNVLLEAMSCGKPVVATRVGGIPEIIVEGETGLLCQPGDIDGLTRTLKRCTEREWDCEAISKYSEKYTWEKNITKFQEIVSNVMRK